MSYKYQTQSWNQRIERFDLEGDQKESGFNRSTFQEIFKEQKLEEMNIYIQTESEHLRRANMVSFIYISPQQNVEKC